MAQVNGNYLKLKAGYLFPEIARRVKASSEAHPEAPIIRLGIGDVTEPLPEACRTAMKAAIDEMGTREGFHGYGPEQGYLWLREAIAQHDFQARGCDIADFLEPDVAGLIDLQLLTLLLAGRDELEDIDTHDVARCKAVLELAGHEVLGRGLRENHARGALPLDHVEPREHGHGRGRRLEVARAARIHPRIDFAAEERGCKRCGHGHATKRRNEASWQRSAAVEGTEGSAGFWIRMHDLDSGVAVGANQAIHLEGLRSRVALIGSHGVGI